MSEVKFNNLGGNYNFYQKEQKPDVKEEAPKAQVAPEHKSVKSEDVLNAMSLMGAQNFAQVSAKSVNQTKELSQDRISSIEDSMKLFEAGVNKYADAINAEFGGMFSEETTLALAANMFAREA